MEIISKLIMQQIADRLGSEFKLYYINNADEDIEADIATTVGVFRVQSGNQTLDKKNISMVNEFSIVFAVPTNDPIIKNRIFSKIDDFTISSNDIKLLLDTTINSERTFIQSIMYFDTPVATGTRFSMPFINDNGYSDVADFEQYTLIGRYSATNNYSYFDAELKINNEQIDGIFNVILSSQNNSEAANPLNSFTASSMPISNIRTIVADFFVIGDITLAGMTPRDNQNKIWNYINNPNGEILQLEYTSLGINLNMKVVVSNVTKTSQKGAVNLAQVSFIEILDLDVLEV